MITLSVSSILMITSTEINSDIQATFTGKRVRTNQAPFVAFNSTFATWASVCMTRRVEKGLERALKVDRESFHETDPHYLVLQHAIFQELRAISSYVIEADKATLEKMVTSATNGKVGLSLVAEQAAQPIALDNGRLLFNPESDKWAGSTAERLQSQA